MRSTTHSVVALAACLLLAGLVDCRCPDKNPPPPKPDGERSVIRTKPVYRFPSNQLRRQMRRLHMISRELRRQVNGGYMASARFALKRLDEMSTATGTPKVFITELAAMKEATRRLQASKQLKRDYALFVERCVSCHEKLAKDYVRVVTKLRLDDETKKKTP